MKEIQNMPSRTLMLWLASHSTGTMIHVGCRMGRRAAAWAAWRNALRLERRIIAMDWSGEHRRSRKQQEPVLKYELGIDARRVEGVEVLDTDPALFPFDQLQPIGFALIDYDYKLAGLRRVSEPILAAAPVLANPNVIVAWQGYDQERQFPPPDYPCEVKFYVNSLDVGDTYSVQGGNLAFKVFNMTPDFRNELKERAAI